MINRRCSSSVTKSRGFTLLELMVAVGVLAIVATAVYFRNAETITQQGKLEERTFATWMLHNHINLRRIRYLTKDPDDIEQLAPETSRLTFGNTEYWVELIPGPALDEHLQYATFTVHKIVDGKRIGPLQSLTTVLML